MVLMKKCDAGNRSVVLEIKCDTENKVRLWEYKCSTEKCGTGSRSVVLRTIVWYWDCKRGTVEMRHWYCCSRALRRIGSLGSRVSDLGYLSFVCICSCAILLFY